MRTRYLHQDLKNAIYSPDKEWWPINTHFNSVLAHIQNYTVTWGDFTCRKEDPIVFLLFSLFLPIVTCNGQSEMQITIAFYLVGLFCQVYREKLMAMMSPQCGLS